MIALCGQHLFWVLWWERSKVLPRHPVPHPTLTPLRTHNLQPPSLTAILLILF